MGRTHTTKTYRDDSGLGCPVHRLLDVANDEAGRHGLLEKAPQSPKHMLTAYVSLYPAAVPA